MNIRVLINAMIDDLVIFYSTELGVKREQEGSRETTIYRARIKLRARKGTKRQLSIELGVILEQEKEQRDNYA